MVRKSNQFETLLQLDSCREFEEIPHNWSIGLTLPEAQKLTRHIENFNAQKTNFNLGIIHSYTSDLLDPWLKLHAELNRINLNVYHAPYGLNIMEAQAGSGLIQHQPELTLFMLQREDLHPQLKSPITGFSQPDQQTIKKKSINQLLSILKQFRPNLGGQMLISILPSRFPPESGLYDTQNALSERNWWAQFKQEISQQISDQLESTLYYDMDEIVLETGRAQFFDLRYWYTSRFPFKPMAANCFSKKILDIAKLMITPKAKVIVLDADNTLWGGVIGEEGINGIALGPEYPGNAFVDFQRRILDFKERGFILAMCSKNNRDDVIDVFQNHPHQILKENTFSALRINWDTKPSNIKALAKELNLGLDSFIFVDDSDYECGMVRKELPQVQVIQTPKKPTEIPYCLEQLSRLEILNLTEEDKNKTQMYAQERQRKALHEKVDQNGGDIEDYLLSLQMKMQIEINAAERISRLAQLTQKTNQFNLTTKRYSEQQIQTFIEANDWLVASFSLADSYGDSGVVGLIIIQIQDENKARIDTLLMSCRVIGRKAETAFTESVLALLTNQGINQVEAEYIATAKNQLVAEFYPNHHFIKQDEKTFMRNLYEQPAESAGSFPMEINIK